MTDIAAMKRLAEKLAEKATRSIAASNKAALERAVELIKADIAAHEGQQVETGA